VRFEFATSQRVVFGPGVLSEAAPAARTFGRRALVVVSSTDRAAGLIAQLRDAGLSPLPFLVTNEPSVTSVLDGLQQARASKCDVVLAMGGGSALDSGKAIAALLGNPGEITDYLEVIGKGQPVIQAPVACIAIPTTAGTGAEVTRNAVITIQEKNIKVSLRGPALLTRLAIVDPELTYSLPADLTATTGMDALTQLIEPYVSNSSNPVTDAICREGLQRAARSLARAHADGGDRSAREDMSLASLFGGLALANARLGAVHGMAGPIGGMCHAPHGAVCAKLLPLVMETNLRALQTRQPDSPVLRRFEEIARLLTGKGQASAEDGVDWVKNLVAALGIRPLGSYGLSERQFPTLVEQSRKASSMTGNPIVMKDEELLQILARAV
jgi:alcohol dehydrogenase class IV